MRSPLFSLLLPLLVLLPVLSSALHFYLDASENKCFLEELPVDTIVEGSSLLPFDFLSCEEQIVRVGRVSL
jgi:hypothetical protein